MAPLSGRTGLLAVPAAVVTATAAVLGLHELSLTDPVTGLANRAALVRRLGAEQRDGFGRPCSLALVRISGLASEMQGYVSARPLEGNQLAAGAWDVQTEISCPVPRAAESPVVPS